MNTLMITLLGLGLTYASGPEKLRRRLAGSADFWEETLYYMNAEGVGSGRCEEGYMHQIFNQQECESAVEDLGYEVKTTKTVNAWGAVCGCSFNAETGHVQFNKFAHPQYCYATEANKHEQSMPAQDKNSEENGLTAVCYGKGSINYDKVGDGKECPDQNKVVVSNTLSNSAEDVAKCANLVYNDERCDGRYFEVRKEKTQCRCNKKGSTCNINSDSNTELWEIFEIVSGCHDLIEHCDVHMANGGCLEANEQHHSWRTNCVKTCGFCGDARYYEREVDTTPDYNVDNYYFNVDGIGSGRCEDGADTQIHHVKECEYAVESLGYEVKTTKKVNAWGAVCGCSFNAETGHVQFNEFAHPQYCYATDANKHEQAMPLQDRNSRENRLVAVCYQKPEFDADTHPGVTRGNNYLNLAGVGSGRCERGYDDQIFDLHDCLAAVETLGYEANTILIKNAWDSVCGCSINPETNHVQYNKFAHPQYCYATEANKHVGAMPAQDRDSREERLVAVCHHYGDPTSEPTSVPTAIPTAVPTATPTANPTATPTAVPTATPTAIPTANPTATPTALPTADPTAIPTVDPTAIPTAVPTANPTAWGRVTMFSGDDFDGSEWVFDTLGDYAAGLGDFKNDVVSSIIVEGDFKATVYVNCPQDLDMELSDMVESLQNGGSRHGHDEWQEKEYVLNAMRMEEYCLTAGGASDTLTAGRYGPEDMGIPINTLSYLRIEENHVIGPNGPAQAPGTQAPADESDDAPVAVPDGYVNVGRGACRDSDGEIPVYLTVNTGHHCGDGHHETECRSPELVNACAKACTDLDDCYAFQVLHGRGDCLVYHGSGSCDPAQAVTTEWWWDLYEKEVPAPTPVVPATAPATVMDNTLESASDLPAFIKHTRGENECPDLYEKVTSSAECREACNELGWAKDTHGDRDGQSFYPFGCIENGLFCYWNSNTGNSKNNSRSVVCRAK